MYEIYALKVAEQEIDAQTYYYQAEADGKAIMLHYFLCLKNDEHTILIDTGVSREEMASRGVNEVNNRTELLSRINVKPEDIEAIILTHLHNDHFAEPEIYPNCIFYVQRKEFAFWTQDVQRFHSIFSPPFLKGRTCADTVTLQRLNFEKRVRFLDGDTEVYPGIQAIWCGAHSPGSQFVVVQTSRGKVVCCSDFLDTYRNLEALIPVGVVTNLQEWIVNIQKIENMRLPKQSIIPGHDPEIMNMFTKVAEDVVKIA